MSSGPAASALEPSRENNAPSVDESALVATINSPISSWLDQAIFAQHRSVPLFRVPRSPDAIKAYKNSYAASVILSLPTGARVKRFSPTPFPGRLRFCRSAIALSQEGFLRMRPKPCVLSIGRWTQGLTTHLSGKFCHNCCFELPALRGGRRPTQAVGRCFRHRMTQACLHMALHSCAVVPVFAQHQVQPHGQLARHCHFGQCAMLAHRQPPTEAAQLRVVTRRRLSRFHQQKAQKRTALLADAPQLLPPAAGMLARNQAKIAAHLARILESFRRPQRQHHGQRRHRTHSRMRHQPPRRRPPFSPTHTTTETSPRSLRVGLTIISTSCPSAVRNSINRSTEKAPDRLRISAET